MEKEGWTKETCNAGLQNRQDERWVVRSNDSIPPVSLGLQTLWQLNQTVISHQRIWKLEEENTGGCPGAGAGHILGSSCMHMIVGSARREMIPRRSIQTSMSPVDQVSKDWQWRLVDAAEVTSLRSSTSHSILHSSQQRQPAPSTRHLSGSFGLRDISFGGNH
jgi:hypothetical protein